MKYKIIFNGVQYDAVEEYYFHCYIFELFNSGFIKEFGMQPFEISLTSGLYNNYVEKIQLKTRIKKVDKKQTILYPSVYTPDFNIVWNEKSNGIFYNLLNDDKRITTPFIANELNGDIYSIVECKPTFDSRNMTRLFINNQKFIWDKYNKYINLIHIVDLFEKTFTPAEYLLTPTGKPKKLKYIPKTLNQFLHDR